MIEAEYTGANNSLMCVPRVNGFGQVEYVNSASVSVLWSGPDVTYYLETEADPLTGIICIFHNNVFMFEYPEQ